MDRAELISKLENFKQACVEIGCIDVNNENALDLEEAYSGVEPVSYIIDMVVKQAWLDKDRPISALRELIDLLYDKVDVEARKDILTFRIHSQPKEVA